jgi:uncharacterized caspase-like protein
MRWAIVIGIDKYGDNVPNLNAAVRDAENFNHWVTDKAGANVPEENVRLLLGRTAGEPDQDKRDVEPTKDNIMWAINDVMDKSEGVGEKLYVFFSGHGITSTYANREESALATSGFDERNTEQTVAVRSIAEFFETTQFKDQFFFVDACRNKPSEHLSEIGKWSIPRRRDPGQPPVQQFILYATSPGREAAEIGWPGEAVGAFSEVLMRALEGRGRAKAWSWERNCYEVRWESLATYVKSQMEQRKKVSDPEEMVQVPQDAGSRGVEGRDRDARLASVPQRGIPSLDLELELKADSTDEVEVIVRDAIGQPVARALRVTDSSYTFTLPPRTYAVEATTTKGRVGRLRLPVELYDEDDDTKKTFSGEIVWEEAGATAEEEGDGDGTIEIRSTDPLAVADVTDETGRVVGVATVKVGCVAPPGFYRVRDVGPEHEDTGEAQLVALRPGKCEPVTLTAPAPQPHVARLAEALGGRAEPDHVVPIANAEPASWAQPSTVVAAAIDAALHDDDDVLRRLGLDTPREVLGELSSGVALYAVASDGNSEALEALRVRMWPAGGVVPDESRPLRASAVGIAVELQGCDKPVAHWLSIEVAGTKPTVIAVPVLQKRLATLVAQVNSDGLRVYQFHPLLAPAESSTPGRLRRLEHLQRFLLGGRLDGAVSLAEELAAQAGDDPFAGCLAGYVLLRLGRREGLGKLASAIVAVAPELSDGYILRGEYEAYKQNSEASGQAFADAVAAGIPAFGEGLTRLVEGLRVSGFVHPRGWLVRYIFQQHARGLMWAAFNPRGDFKPGRLMVTGVDVGYEG